MSAEIAVMRNRSTQRYVSDTCDSLDAASHGDVEDCDRTNNTCKHIRTAIRLSNLEKVLPHATYLNCKSCCSVPTRKKKGKNNKVINAVEMSAVCTRLCLTCCLFLCDHTAKDHSLVHFHDKRSHSVVVDIRTLIDGSPYVWCYSCDEQVDIEYVSDDDSNLSKALLLVIKYIPSFKSKETKSVSMPSVDSGIVIAEDTNSDSGLAEGGPRGLRNLGNTCFFNSVLQCLSVVYPTIAAQPSFISITESDHGLLTVAFRDTMMGLTANSVSKQREVVPSLLFSNVCARAPRFRGHQQQDSHELYTYLLRNMEDEAIKFGRSNIDVDSDICNSTTSSNESGCRKQPIPESVSNTFVTNTFGGNLDSIVVCSNCEQASVFHDHFISLSISLAHAATSRNSKLPGVSRASSTSLLMQLNVKAAKQAEKSKKKLLKNVKRNTLRCDSECEESCNNEDTVDQTSEADTDSTERLKDCGEDSDIVSVKSSTTSCSEISTDVIINHSQQLTSEQERHVLSLAQRLGFVRMSDPCSATDGSTAKTTKNASRHAITLSSCLESFFAAELLTGTNRYECSVCTRNGGSDTEKVYTHASKQFVIRKSPAVLVLHLKRFQQISARNFRKDMRHVSFDLKVNLDPFTVETNGNAGTTSSNEYDLVGVVAHSGTMHSGHYISYVRGLNDTWYLVSDSSVKCVPFSSVSAAVAYLLFYKRRDCDDFLL